MPLEFQFTCALEHGIHARPASVLADAVRAFAARVSMTKTSTGKSADVRSVLSMVALSVGLGDSCVIVAEGDDAVDAIAALQSIIEQGFGEAKADAAQTAAITQEAQVPAGLRKLGVNVIAGRGISPGFAQGPVVMAVGARSGRSMLGDQRPSQSDHRSAVILQQEHGEAQRALREVRQALQTRLESVSSELERDLLKAHISIAEDPALREKINENVAAGASAEAAIRNAGEFFAGTLKASASAYVRDRAIDVEDVCGQLLERLGVVESGGVIELRRPSIIVADTLTPRQMMMLDRKFILALVLGRVGATSHTVILARAFGIPTIVDVHDVENVFRQDQAIIVDAGGGFVLSAVSEDVQRYYEIEHRMNQRRRERLKPFVGDPAKTRCGTRLDIGANVSMSDEVAPAMSEGADGVGLFRTEMLFLDRAAPPTETEQFEAYSKAVASAGQRSVIFRTFDIGGDKPAPYLRLPREENPFLGWRGIRLYEQFPELLHGQLSAIVRASALGHVKVMAPMVSTIREAEWFVGRVREVQSELRNKNVKLDPKMAIGVMIETPAAALAIPQLSKVVDFFSIGTNDLCQYFMAADRGDPRVASLCDPLEPAFLSLLQRIAEEANVHKKWVGLCGEMAGDVLHLPLLADMGLDEISVAPAPVLELKAAFCELDILECRELLARALSCGHASEVRSMLTSFAGNTKTSPILQPDLVAIESDAASKVEVIKELVSMIAAAGRTNDANAIENAVWAREETYATGMGHSFAIPHCKSVAIRSPTIAVLGLKNPVDWGAADGELVRMAIMLAIPDVGTAQEAAKKHMQVLARLARQLMHEEFRDRIMQAKNPEAIVAALMSGLEE